MSAQWAQWLAWKGTIGRRSYVMIGGVAFLIKHNMDRLVASFLFHREWEFYRYLVPFAGVAKIVSMPVRGQSFYGALVALAIPFIWMGVGLTIARLRDLRWPTPLALLFFVPYVNLVFFALLSVWPGRTERAASTGPGRRSEGLLSRVIPTSRLGSTAAAVVLAPLLGLALTLLAANILQTYGWGLFVGMPFAMGFLATILYSWHEPRSFLSCIGVAWLSVGILALLLFGVAVEGAICLLMAAPLGLIMATMGAWLGYSMQERAWSRRDATATLAIVLLGVPGMEVGGHLLRPEPSVFRVETSVVVNAPPGAVWNQVVAFSQIAEPTEWLFRAGIAYPIRAEIAGQGAGAIRRCVFSTGAFVEPITVWDEPRRLAFSVRENPAPMEEWTPYKHIEPPHLRGFLVSQAGEFRLVVLAGGRTRLEGTTWYRHSLWPAEYWRIWSDAIIHRIHLRVLRHIQQLAEKELAVQARAAEDWASTRR